MTESAHLIASANEHLRDAHEKLLMSSLALDQARRQARRVRHRHARVTLAHKHALIALRWGSVAMLLVMLREIWQPARFIAVFPQSWAYKLASYSAEPALVSLWFTICGALLLPLIIILAIRPGHRLCGQAQDFTAAGLMGGTMGYAFLCSAAMRLDVPHIVDSYIGSTAVLAVSAVLVANWHNSLVMRAHELQREGLARRCHTSAVH